MLKYDEIPNWLVNLENEDLMFIKKLIIFSGSLKDLANEYGVTYPTIRIRMNKIIEKVNLYDKKEEDEYISKIKSLALSEKIDIETAKYLIQEYRRVKNEK